MRDVWIEGAGASVHLGATERDMKDPWWTIVYRGILWAIVLAYVAFLVRGAGIRTLPFIGLPLLATWVLGERRGYSKGIRDLKEAMGLEDK